MANEGHYQREGGTRQGIYVCSPNGQLLSSINSLDPNEVINILEHGLKQWKKLSGSYRKLPPDHELKPEHRWEDSFPENGLILTSANTDLLSDPPVQENRSDRSNLDHIWFSQSEIADWLPNELEVGEKYDLPDNLFERLIRFHLVDNVRGQTLPFASQEIKSGKIQFMIDTITDNIAELSISGNSQAVAKGEWQMGENDWKPYYLLDHGMRTQILGHAQFDLEKQKFVEFEMVALGFRYGVTENNGRFNSPDSSYVGFLFTLDDRADGNKIPPAFVDVYNAEWISHP